MTAEKWLAARTPRPPANLAAALRSAVAATVADNTTPVSRRLIGAAGSLLSRVVEAGCAERSGALDLLTLDALLSYAMEAASGSAAECECAATDALDVIGAAAATLDAAPPARS